MDTALILLIALFVSAIAIAFYMDWLGLWVSKEELAKEIAKSKHRSRELHQPMPILVPVVGALIAIETGSEASRVA